MARRRFERDYYAALGVHPEATEEEIRRAYRRLALQWHPDRNPGNPRAADRFKEVSEAYAVLIDPAKRREYDHARRLGAPGEFRHSREDVFRDLFADPRASAIFEELARELTRMGLHVDRRHFEQTLFGGRVVVTGGVIVISPLTPVWALARLAGAALRGARRTAVAAPAGAAPPPPRSSRGVLRGLVDAARWLWGSPARAFERLEPGRADVEVPLRLTPAEMAAGVSKRITLETDGRAEAVLVRVPPGLAPGTRLRLRGKGRRGREGHRGDAYLVVEVGE